MDGSFKVGRAFGIDIGIHWSWIFIFFIVTWSFATGVLDHFYPEWSDGQRWTVAALVSVVFFLSILAHELSHAIVSNRSGLPVRSITLFVFGGVANLSREPDRAGLEFKIAVVGPLTSIVVAALFAIGWLAMRPFNDGLAGVSANLALINTSIAVFNMLPGFPLDGGRVLRAIIWARNRNRLRSTQITSRVGEGIAYGVMALGIAYTYFVNPFSGLWFLLIGFFLRNAAAASYQQLLVDTTLSGVFVRDVMQKDVDVVAPELTLRELVDQHVMRRNARCFAVIAAGEFAGLITLTDVRQVPPEQWAATSVYRAMTPVTRLHTVAPSQDIAAAMQVMAREDVNQLPVVDGRELAGMLTRADVMRYIRLREDLSDGGLTGSVTASGPPR